jgi:hypothetical protein
MKANPTFLLELTLRDEDLNPIHTITACDFTQNDMDLSFIDADLKEAKEILFDLLKNHYLKNKLLS